MLCTTTTVNLSSTGSAAFNAGVEFASDAINGIGTDSFIRASVSSVVIGANATILQSSIAAADPVLNR